MKLFWKKEKSKDFVIRKRSKPMIRGKVQKKNPKKGIRFLLICSDGHENWVYDLPMPSTARIGSSRSKVKFIRCLTCNETLKGGELYR